MNFDDLLQSLLDDIDSMTTDLQEGIITTDEWYTAMSETLTRFHLAAYMIGQGGAALTAVELAQITPIIQAQLNWLDNFYLEIISAIQWQLGFNARAAMYAGAIKESYWKGQTKILPLPAMPAQGTQCLTNCGCYWDIRPLDEAKGDYDAYWMRGKNDSCQTCLEREAQWNPYQIRDGMAIGPT